MKEIILSTESASDIPQELAEKYNVQIVPMHVIMDQDNLADSFAFPVSYVYNHCARTRKPPRTAPPSEKEFTNYFTDIRAAYPDSVILHFSVSASVSRAYQNAQDASGNFEDIYVINTRTVSAGCIAYIVAAWEYIQAQGEITDYAALAREIRLLAPQIAFGFLPGNLEFVMLSEKVEDARELAGSKPVIEPDAVGKLVGERKFRGSKNRIAPSFVRDFVEEHDLRRDALYFAYTAGTSKRVMETVEKIANELGFETCYAIQVCGVSTTYAGPQTIGLAGIIAGDAAIGESTEETTAEDNEPAADSPE